MSWLQIRDLGGGERGGVKMLYLDESGDHDLVNITPDASVFVLGGIILDRTYARTVLEPRVRDFKFEWFGTDRIILHSIDISRATRGFERLRTDRGFRTAFLAALSAVMAELDYKVLACVIHKDQHIAKYGKRAFDPYDLGLEILVERFCAEIGDTPDGGIIYAEKRRSDLDHGLDVAWERLRAHGTGHFTAQRRSQVDKRIIGLGLKAKSVNIAGLQLADLVISPIRRHHLGLRTHDNWDIIRDKLCADSQGRVAGYGLVVLPKQG